MASVCGVNREERDAAVREHRCCQPSCTFIWGLLCPEMKRRGSFVTVS